MKQLVIKIDRFILDQLTNYIRKWIEKREYEQHKIDFKIKMLWINFFILLVLAIIIPTILYLVQNSFFQAGLSASMWGFVLLLHFIHIKWVERDYKPHHDLLFSLRKNPIYYNMEKQILEEMFVQGRRERIITSVSFVFVNILVVGLLISGSIVTNSVGMSSDYIAAYLLISGIFSFIERYIFYVFDFDEPIRKKKVPKESLTEIMLRSWQQLLKPKYI